MFPHIGNPGITWCGEWEASGEYIEDQRLLQEALATEAEQEPTLDESSDVTDLGWTELVERLYQELVVNKRKAGGH